MTADQSRPYPWAELEGVEGRDLAGETVMGMRVAAYRHPVDCPSDMDPEAWRAFFRGSPPNTYAEHWSTPGAHRTDVERLFREADVRAAIEAARGHGPSEEGGEVVPLTPSDEMMLAGIKAGNARSFDVDGRIGWVQTRAIYEAMLSAARRPSAPIEGGMGDGWIEWHGGENPAPGCEVIVCFRDERREKPWRPASRSAGLRWDHRRSDTFEGRGDIIAYRIARPQPTPGKDEGK